MFRLVTSLVTAGLLLAAFSTVSAQVSPDGVVSAAPGPQEISARVAPTAYDAIRLTNDGAESINPRAVVDGDFLYVAWEDTRTGVRQIYWQKFSRATGNPAVTPVRVSNSGATSIEPAIGIDSYGNSYIVWQEGTLYGTIRGTKIGPDGTVLIAPVALSPSVCLRADIATQPDGGSWVVFERKAAGDHDCYIRRFSSSLVMSCDKRANETSLPPDDKTPVVAVATDGSALCFRRDLDMWWQDGIYYEGAPAGCGNLSGRLQVGGAYELPAIGYSGVSWWGTTHLSGNVYLMYGTASVYRVNDVSSTAGAARVGDDPDFAYCVWSDTRDGHSEIYLSQANSNTPYTDIRLTDNPSSKGRPDIATNTAEAGKWWVVWSDNRDGNAEIYFTGNALVPPSPHLVVDPAALSFQAQHQAPLPASQTIAISNSGADILNWEVTNPESVSWLSIDPPTSGTGNSATVTVRITTTDLNPQAYATTIRVTSSNADNSPQDVAVAYQVDFGPIDPGVAQQKQDIINYFNGIPFYSDAESKAQTFVNLVSAHIENGSVTQEELEATLRLLVMEEAAKAAYWSTDEANVPAIARLTARSMEKASLEIILDRLFSYIGKHFERLKNSPLLGWLYRSITGIQDFFGSAITSHNSALAANFANSLAPGIMAEFGVTREVADRLALEYAWDVIGGAGEELYAVPLDQLQEEMLVDPLAMFHVRIYENGLAGVGGTQRTLTDAVTAAENGQFLSGQGQAAAGAIRNLQIPQIVADNTSCVATMNNLLTAAEIIDLVQTYSLVAELVLAATALIVGVALCTAFAVGCVFGAIAGFIGWGVIAKLQILFTWAKVITFSVAAGIGLDQMHHDLPTYLKNAQATAFEEINGVQMPAAELFQGMPRYRVSNDWADSLALASSESAGRLTAIRNDIAIGDWTSVQNRLAGLDSSLQNLSAVSSAIGSIVGLTYLTNHTDSTSSVDSALNRAMAHAESVNMSVALAQLATGFGAAAKPDGPTRDSVLLTVDSCIARLQAMPPVFDSTLTQFANLGYTVPPLVVFTGTSMPSTDTAGTFTATIRNISQAPVHEISARLSVTDSAISTVHLTGDTLLPLLNAGAEQTLEWKIRRRSTDTLFQLELQVMPENLPGDFIGDSKLISVDYPYGIPCCTGTTGNVNMAGIVDLSDLSALVSYLTGGGYTLPCVDEANVNSADIVDLSDLSALVSYLTGGGYVLPNCP